MITTMSKERSITDWEILLHLKSMRQPTHSPRGCATHILYRACNLEARKAYKTYVLSVALLQTQDQVSRALCFCIAMKDAYWLKVEVLSLVYRHGSSAPFLRSLTLMAPTATATMTTQPLSSEALHQ
jgi:hypothetical protein